MITPSGACTACQQATEQERLAQLEDILGQYAETPGALIPVLQMAQAIFGYLPDVALRRISVALGKSYSEVAGVVGFYSFFTTVPRGRHIIRVCLGTACYVRGGKEVLQALRNTLRVEVGETTADGEYDVRLYRTWRGRYLDRQTVECKGGKLTCTVPELKTTGGHALHIGSDVAFKIMPK